MFHLMTKPLVVCFILYIYIYICVYIYIYIYIYIRESGGEKSREGGTERKIKKKIMAF